MMYDVVLVIESVWAFNSSDAKHEAASMINEREWDAEDLDAFCHQIKGKRKRV